MGMGQNINTFIPCIAPPLRFTGIYSGGAVQQTETFEEAEKKRKKQIGDKAAADFLKRLETLKQQTENLPILKAKIKDIEAQNEELDNILNRAKNGKESEDGTIKVKDNWQEYNKLPWWKKGLRGGSHLLQGTWKLATGFFGYEVDEKTGESKWNWKKCLKNTVIAAGCIALTAVPVVGPVISTGLLATGVVCGAVGTGKGVIKAINAKTPEELDNAYQDIGAGLTIGVTSALGVRGLGKGLQSSSAVNGSNAAMRSVSNNAVKQFVKDSTVNTFRATVQGIKNDKSSIVVNGFGKTYKTNLKGTIPKLGKTKFENTKNNVTQSIDARLNQISNELNNPNITPISKALLEQEQTSLNSQLVELNSTVTKDCWINLKKDSKAHNNLSTLKDAAKEIQTTGSVNINGNCFNMSKENFAELQACVSRAKKLSKDIENLAKLRSVTMKKMAFMKKYKTDVEAYTGKTRANRAGRIYDAAKISKADITCKKALISPLKMTWEATMIPFKPWNYVQKSSTSSFYKLEETLVPTYEEGFLTTGFLAEALNIGERTLKTRMYITDEDGKEVEQEVDVTKEIVAQLEEQQKQNKEALEKAKSDLSQIYIA